MGSSDHDTIPTTEVVSRRRRWAWITVLAVAVIGGSALVAVPAIAEDGSGSGPGQRPGQKLIVCESGVVDHGDGIQTSSASVERVAADAPVPEGCRSE